MVKEYRRKSINKLIFKIDCEKAYDHVELDFSKYCAEDKVVALANLLGCEVGT